MVAQKITSNRKLESDLVIRQTDTLINFEAVIVNNPAAVARPDLNLFGMPIGNLVRVDEHHYTGDLLLTAATAADIDAIVVDDYTHSFGATGAADDATPDRIRMIVRGPGVINIDKMPVNDPAGAAYDRTVLRDGVIRIGLTPRYEPEVVEVAPGP